MCSSHQVKCRVADKKHEIKHGKYTVSEDVLMSLIDKHPLPRIALEYRQVAASLHILIYFLLDAISSHIHRLQRC